MRLDRAVIARGLARSRTHAAALIADGSVTVGKRVITKPSFDVPDDASIRIADEADMYVSRAAHKLKGALDSFIPLGLSVSGARCLDAGASTGGFTQVLLEHGAAHVVAVDVGHDQLADEIRADARVTVHEGMNVRDLDSRHPDAGVQLVVGDLSFISLTKVIEPLLTWCDPRADVVLMVKPQFEMGKERLGQGGIVRSVEDRAWAIETVIAAMRDADLRIHGVERSILPGPHGNIEFFVWGSIPRQAGDNSPERQPEVSELDDAGVSSAIAKAVKEG